MTDKKANKMITTASKQGSVHIVYLDEPIGPPEQYRELKELLIMGNPEDEILLMLNGPGGSLHTAIELSNLISQSPAHVIGHITGEVCSAHAMITLSCHSWVLYPVSALMLHTFSGGSWGKAPDLRAGVNATIKLCEDLLESVAYPFVTEEELKDVYEGKDLWIHGNDLQPRLDRLATQRQLDAEAEEVSHAKEAIEHLSTYVGSK